MTSDDRNDLVPAQSQKLEWVTPKISLMGAEETEGNKLSAYGEQVFQFPPYAGGGKVSIGPS